MTYSPPATEEHLRVRHAARRRADIALAVVAAGVVTSILVLLLWCDR